MVIALLGFLILFGLMLIGMPIGFSMLLVGFAGYGFVNGFDVALYALAMVPYENVAVYTLSVLPMFVLMGEFASLSGIVSDGFEAAFKWLGRIKGGGALATISASGVFAACTGSSVAGASLMTNLAVPEMRKHKYKYSLAAGTVAAGGTLGILIPPSVPLVVYGLLTDTSIGKLFIAGILPGILLITLFALAIFIQVKIDPSIAPSIKEKYSLRERLEATKKVWMMLLLILIVLGGIWGGVFTASEAGAVGSAGSFLILALRGKLTFSNVVTALKTTIKTSTMVFIILIGANIFSQFLAVTQTPFMLAEMVAKMGIPPVAVILVIMLIYMFLGSIMETMSMVVLTLPIFAPIVTSLGYDLIWFGILVTINSEMAMITPPVGMNVFIVGGILKNKINTKTVYKGVAPFVIGMAICILLVLIFPQLATFLPNMN